MDKQTEAVFEKLVRVLCGEIEVADATDIIAPDVHGHFDDRDIHGFGAWAMFVSYLRTHNKFSRFGAEILKLVENDDGTISAVGHWYGEYQGKRYTSHQLSPRYRLENGMIVEIWTTRTNYILPLGKIMKYRFGAFLVLVRIWLGHRLSSWRSTASETVSPGVPLVEEVKHYASMRHFPAGVLKALDQHLDNPQRQFRLFSHQFLKIFALNL